MRIAFLGDSLTWGGYGGNWVAGVAQRLPEHEIINAGIGGNTVINLLRRIDQVLDSAPDAIFTLVGGNDAVSYLYPKTRSYYRQGQGIESGFVTPDEFRHSYRELLTQIHLNHTHAWVGITNTEYNAELYAMVEQYNAITLEVTNSLQVPVLDLREHFTPNALPDREAIDLKFIQVIGQREATEWDDYAAERDRLGYTFTFDGMHLTPQAAEQFADVVTNFIQNHVE